MENELFYDKHLPVKYVTEITEQKIELVYKEPGDWFGQCMAATCFSVAPNTMRQLFRRLGNVVSVELVKILCVETCSYRKKFTIQNKTAYSFDFYRNGIKIKSFKWREPFYIESNDICIEKPSLDVLEILSLVYQKPKLKEEESLELQQTALQQ